LAYDDRLRIEAEFKKPEVADTRYADSDYVGSVGGSKGAWMMYRVNAGSTEKGREAAAHCVGLRCVGYGGEEQGGGAK
jgi:hypothetical protein